MQQKLAYFNDTFVRYAPCQLVRNRSWYKVKQGYPKLELITVYYNSLLILKAFILIVIATVTMHLWYWSLTTLNEPFCLHVSFLHVSWSKEEEKTKHFYWTEQFYLHISDISGCQSRNVNIVTGGKHRIVSDCCFNEKQIIIGSSHVRSLLACANSVNICYVTSSTLVFTHE